MNPMKTFRRILVALSLILGLTLPVALTSGTAFALGCSFSPGTRVTSTYGGAYCNNTPGAYPFYYRARITCEYWTPGIPGTWVKHNYTVRGNLYAVNSGNWSWAYCQNHGAYQHGSFSSAGPDWVLHLDAEFDPPGWGTGSGGYSRAY